MAYALVLVFAFPTVLAAAFWGTQVAQAHSDAWLFAIVVVAGSVLGFGAALLYGLLLNQLEQRVWGGCGCGLAYAAAIFWVGPAVALLVAGIVDWWW